MFDPINYFVVMFKILRGLLFLAVFLFILFIPVCFVSFTMFSDDQGRPYGVDVSKYNEAAFGWVYWMDENWFDNETDAERNMSQIDKDVRFTMITGWNACEHYSTQSHTTADCMWEKWGPWAIHASQSPSSVAQHGLLGLRDIPNQVGTCSVSNLEMLGPPNAEVIPRKVIAVFAERLPHSQYCRQLE
jgi:hypothetical protein